MKQRNLRNLNFELAYLVTLTETGLKPLSRWEKQLQNNEKKVIHSLGLRCVDVKRILQSGSSTYETIFSTSDKMIELYLSLFDGREINKSPDTMRREGYLFGFPPCCIESFIIKDYVKNDLSKRDQEILFHWSCPGCLITPHLLPVYRQCYHQCQGIFRGEAVSPHLLQLTINMRRAVSFAASLIMFSSLGKAQSIDKRGNLLTNDPHWLQLPENLDYDKDNYFDHYETIMGLNPSIQDSDSNGVADGIQKAKELFALYSDLPDTVQKDSPYITHFLMWGLEKCGICDSMINMGHAEITNPLEDLKMIVPYISLHHFLEHGSFQYDGDVHGRGSLDPALLELVLTSNGPSHRIQINQDIDQDCIPDTSEPFIGTDEMKIDSDNDGMIDGVKWALRYASLIRSLPREKKEDQIYIVDYAMRGIIACPCCGESVNMGYMEIINPIKNEPLTVSYLQLHYMEHGGFLFNDERYEEVTIEKLYKIFVSDGSSHQFPVISDSDEDGLKDDEENQLTLEPMNWDSDDNGISDGSQLAQECGSLIQDLPETEQSDQPYILHFHMYGLETCQICGEKINMGFFRLINPVLLDSVDIHYMGLHCMEHGSFSYYGSIHHGGVDPVQLCRLLSHQPTGIQHIPEKNIPMQITLEQNFPNPFNPETVIGFYLPEETHITLKVYNLLGQIVTTLYEGQKSVGSHTAVWNGNNDMGQRMSTGIYLIQLMADNHLLTRKISLIR